MSDDKPNPFGAVLRKTGGTPGDKTPPGGGGPKPAASQEDKPNPFGATLKSSGSPFGPSINDKKKDAGAGGGDKPNPFGATLKPAGGGGSGGGDKPNPFGATLKPAGGGGGDKPNPFGATLKPTKPTTPVEAKPDASATTAKPAAAAAPAADAAAATTTTATTAAPVAAPDESPVAVPVAASTTNAAGDRPKTPERAKTPDKKTTEQPAQKSEEPAAASASAPAALPEGWAEKKDTSTGKTYYYNKATKETSWKHPGGGGAAVPALAAAADSSSSSQEKPDTSSSSSSALPDGWKEKTDPATGKPFYYNKSTGETSWKKPEGGSTSSKAGGDASSAADSTSGALLEGWKEKKDPATGKPFYYNKSTGETSWKKPESKTGDAAAATTSSSSSSSALPEGWKEKTDPATGKPFYYNKSTGETSWKHPGGAAATTTTTDATATTGKSTTAAAAAADDGAAGGALPEGWKEKKDPSSGKVFYYNKSTGETSWKKPEAGDAKKKEHTPEEIEAAWVQCEDERSGRKYYANKITNEAVWINPVKPKPAAAASSSPGGGGGGDGGGDTSAASAGPSRADLSALGYEEAEDNLGQRYYYNLKTKEVTWTWPPLNTEKYGSDLLLGLPSVGGGSSSRQRGRSMVGRRGSVVSGAGGGGGGGGGGMMNRSLSSHPLDGSPSLSISIGGGGGDDTNADTTSQQQNNNQQQNRQTAGTSSNFSDDVDYDADGNPTTKKRTFFIKRGNPTLYVLGGEGVCDAFRMVMSRNGRVNEWKYLPHMCLPDPLHTVCCAYDLKKKNAAVWGVYTDAMEPTPVETQLLLRAQKQRGEAEIQHPVLTAEPPSEDCRPVPLAAGVAATSGAIICCGGFTNVADGILTSDAWLFDMTTRRTLDLPPLQVPRSSHCVAIVDRSTAISTSWIAFAIGGFNGTRKTTVVERYVLGRDCWEVTNPMKNPRSGFATCVMDRTIYAIGGRSGYGIVNTVETMHAQTNQWAPSAPLRMARAMHSAIVFDGNIIVVGGWTGQEWTGSVERYDPNHDKWATIITLPVPMGHAMLALGEIEDKEAVSELQFG